MVNFKFVPMWRNPLYQTLEFDKVLDDLARRAHCPITAEKLRQLQPLSDADLVQARLDRVTEFRSFMDTGGSIPMETFDDLGPHLAAAAVEGAFLEPAAFRQIHRVLTLSGRLQRFFKEHGPRLPLLSETAERLRPAEGLADKIVRAIDLASLEILDRASPALSNIRREMSQARERVRKRLESLVNALADKGVLQERLITMRSGRWVLPVKETHRHLIKGVLHDKSASGATAYMEPLETLELNNKVRRLEAEERHEVEKVLRLLTGLVQGHRADLRESLDALVDLDTVLASALASKALHQHAPALNRAGVFEVRNGRHPLLVLSKRASTVVPLSLSVGRDFNTLVITGPNAGGKTVALKTLGLLALMTACGLHIPADPDSQLPVFHRIFALVGDAQSIEMDLSTFSAHLRDIKRIVDQGAQGDLVLIDEIGTGTDPQEGAALAMALLETLTARGVLTVVTTHHGALKAFAHRTPGVANGSMTFNGDTLTPTYAFRAHLPGSSYAFEIARRLGLPDGLVNRSRQLVGTEANRLEALILELGKQMEENTALNEALTKEKQIVAGLKAALEASTLQLKEETRAIRQKAVKEAEGILLRANASVEKAIRTIREKQAGKEAIREAKSLIEEQREGLTPFFPAARKQGEATALEGFRPGDRVRWKRGDKLGAVLDSGASGAPVLVAFDDLKIHVPRDELEGVVGSEEASRDRRLRVNVDTPSGVRSEIDVRGMRVEESLAAIDKYLNDVVLAGLREVRIIHGVGTGALRSNIIPFLNQHPLVTKSEPEGGTNAGATLVQIADT